MQKFRQKNQNPDKKCTDFEEFLDTLTSSTFSASNESWGSVFGIASGSDFTSGWIDSWEVGPLSAAFGSKTTESSNTSSSSEVKSQIEVIEKNDF